jgi:hypothetical protein
MLAKLDWRPSDKLLGQFSVWAMFFLGMVACPLAVYRGHYRAAILFWSLAAAARLLAAFRPAWLRPVYVGLMIVTWPIGWLISHLMLGAIYFGVFTPVAIVFRLIGRDPLARRFDRQASSYWEAYQPNRGLARYLRQF